MTGGTVCGSLEAVVRALKEQEGPWAIFLHTNPDGDSIGSSLALGLALETLGRRVAYVYEDDFPEQFTFLRGSERFIPAERAMEQHRAGSPKYKGALLPDIAQDDRLGESITLARDIPFWVNIDHHPTNPGFGDAYWVDGAQPCTGTMVLAIIDALGVELDAPMAEALYTALLTDTGSFAYSNTTAEALRQAAYLVDAGARPHQVSSRVYNNMTVPGLKLLSSALAGIQVEAHEDRGGLAWLTVTQAMLDETGARDAVPEGLVNYPRQIAGTEMALMFFEQEDGSVRVSLRSQDHLDVGALAARFGGGGHARAAGCTVAGPLESAREKVLSAAREAMASAAEKREA